MRDTRRSRQLLELLIVTIVAGLATIYWLVLPVVYTVRLENASELGIARIELVAGEMVSTIQALHSGTKVIRKFKNRRSVERYHLKIVTQDGEEFMADCAYIPWWNWSRYYRTEIAVRPHHSSRDSCPFRLEQKTVTKHGVVDSLPCACIASGNHH